jgi:hypothetical protein
MKIEHYAVKLSTGQTAQCEYDPTGDLLEIYFVQGEATAAVELTDNIVLRFDWDSGTPFSLGIISFSTLLQPSRYGKMHFELLVEEWPEEAQDKILTMLRRPPLTEFLTLSSYTPAHASHIIPTTTIRQIPALVAA